VAYKPLVMIAGGYLIVWIWLIYQPHNLGRLSVTTYDFRTAMKRVGPSVRR
jgi:hypothetical protein